MLRLFCPESAFCFFCFFFAVLLHVALFLPLLFLLHNERCGSLSFEAEKKEKTLLRSRLREDTAKLWISGWPASRSSFREPPVLPRDHVISLIVAISHTALCLCENVAASIDLEYDAIALNYFIYMVLKGLF